MIDMEQKIHDLLVFTKKHLGHATFVTHADLATHGFSNEVILRARKLNYLRMVGVPNEKAFLNKYSITASGVAFISEKKVQKAASVQTMEADLTGEVELEDSSLVPSSARTIGAISLISGLLLVLVFFNVPQDAVSIILLLLAIVFVVCGGIGLFHPHFFDRFLR